RPGDAPARGGPGRVLLGPMARAAAGRLRRAPDGAAAPDVDLRRPLARAARGRLGLARCGGRLALGPGVSAPGQLVPAGQRVEHALALAQRLPPAGLPGLAPP